MTGARGRIGWGGWIARILAAVIVLALVLVAVGLWAVHRSVPVLDGRLRLPGLAAPLSIRRDALGIAVLHGASRLDVARGLGFVHAQERFFEMDLTRRSAAGELSALLGPATLERDRARRVHRLRARLEARFTTMDPPERALLQAYADGVNAGLDQLGARPWQYLLLNAKPQPWRPADSLLVIAEMYWMLQGNSLSAGFSGALLRERAGDALFAFLSPRGGSWDAALDGSVTPPIALPGPALLDLRGAHAPATVGGHIGDTRFALVQDDLDPRVAEIGSNNWAIAGARSVSGGAMLADDMHLGLTVPSIWFRAQFEIDRGPDAIRAAGVTLPGLPAIIAGSNGAVAWGFTNGYGQWFDWVRVPAGLAATRLAQVAERIAVKGADDVVLTVTELDGAPIAAERDGQRYALRWVADQGEAYNLALDAMLGTRDVDAALAVAQRAGMPHQNILLADRAGHIAWTIAGRLWTGSRSGHYGRFEPVDQPPPRWLAPADYPVVKDPPGGQLWTANARQLGGPLAAAIGDGRFDLGARAQQIRDRLAARPRFDEAALGAIQLDDEARFLATWRDRLLAAALADPAHARVAHLIQGWNGRADADQAGYTLLRGARLRVMDALWLAWTTPLLGPAQSDPKQRADWPAMFEYSAAAALDAQPAHLLPPGFANWNVFVLAQLDAMADEMTFHGRRPIEQATWGGANASHVRNVLSRAIPSLSAVLDMPSLPQAGDANMPRVAGPSFGQSERLVVAPGHEDHATLAMPGGQSGHPMSPYYGAGHEAWAAGRTSPLLAGPAQHALELAP